MNLPAPCVRSLVVTLAVVATVVAEGARPAASAASGGVTQVNPSVRQTPSAATVAPQPAPQASPADTFVPDEAFLGVPLYPSARFIASYNAGLGQRYYLFGVAASFDSMVSYYRAVLKDRGELVYDQPAVYMFETGRFREESMAFPPSVTIKDYTWGGSQGYLVALPGGESVRYPTIIQIVPVSPAERR